MESPFLRKLRHGADLTLEDEATLVDSLKSVQVFPADRDIVRDGERSEHVRLVLEGVACRYKLLTNGNRSITAILMPGDFCDLHVAILGQMDHAISALTPCRIVSIPHSTIEMWTGRHPRINRALWWATLVDEAVLRAWLANIGARRGDERVAHLFCELRARLETIGLADRNGYHLPITQQHLGDMVGLSIVHVNRVLRQLREEGVVRFQHGRVKIEELERLEQMAGFNANYLHLHDFPRQTA